MKAILKAVLVVSLMCTTTLAMAAREIKAKDFSGWMDDYDSLVFNEDGNQFVFFNESARGKYDKVLLEPVEVFTNGPRPHEELAAKSSEYLTEGAREIIREKGILATEPGPGVLRYRMAITGVEKSTEDLKAHNLIPVSALFRGAKAATGKLSTYIDAMFEAQLVDSVSGERVAATVRKGIAETEKRSGDELTFEDVKPTLDIWLEAYSATLDAFLAGRE